MATLNDMVLQLSATNDTKKKLSIGQEIIDYLGHPENSVECDDLGGFIDMLVPFMQSSNFKVVMLIYYTRSSITTGTIFFHRIYFSNKIWNILFLGFPKWSGYCWPAHRTNGPHLSALCEYSDACGN